MFLVLSFEHTWEGVVFHSLQVSGPVLVFPWVSLAETFLLAGQSKTLH
jgi:hypothetical protein